MAPFKNFMVRNGVCECRFGKKVGAHDFVILGIKLGFTFMISCAKMKTQHLVNHRSSFCEVLVQGHQVELPWNNHLNDWFTRAKGSPICIYIYMCIMCIYIYNRTIISLISYLLQILQIPLANHTYFKAVFNSPFPPTEESLSITWLAAGTAAVAFGTLQTWRMRALSQCRRPYDPTAAGRPTR